VQDRISERSFYGRTAISRPDCAPPSTHDTPPSRTHTHTNTHATPPCTVIDTHPFSCAPQKTRKKIELGGGGGGGGEGWDLRTPDFGCCCRKIHRRAPTNGPTVAQKLCSRNGVGCAAREGRCVCCATEDYSEHHNQTVQSENGQSSHDFGTDATASRRQRAPGASGV
jgi:hypothetical protein